MFFYERYGVYRQAAHWWPACNEGLEVTDMEIESLATLLEREDRDIDREQAQSRNTLDALRRALSSADEAAALPLCHQLTVQLQHHNLEEERTVRSQAGQTLTPQAAAALRSFVASGRRPGGWVCLVTSADRGARGRCPAHPAAQAGQDGTVAGDQYDA
jgi:hypothetical protein